VTREHVDCIDYGKCLGSGDMGAMNQVKEQKLDGGRKSFDGLG
jgi:hypothetical protein